MADTLNYIDTFTDLLRQAICLISQMKHGEYVLALKQWQIADSMVQSLASQFDVLACSAHTGNEFLREREDDNDSVDSAKIREQIDLMVEEFPEDNEKSSSWTIFNDTFLMFSDEELETIFRKAFIRSKSKNPNECMAEKTQLITQDWSNQICDSSKGLYEEPGKPLDEAVITMSFSDNSNTYTSSSDTDSVHPVDNQIARELTPQLNRVEASVNITTIQQSVNSPTLQKEIKTSLSKDHTVLTSLLEHRTDGAKGTTPNTNQSQHFEIPFSSSGNILSTANKDDLSTQTSSSNNTRLSQSNDVNNFKIEIVMELDKGMANGRNSDSKYKIKIGPEHFNSIFANDFPKRVENNSSSVYVESFRSNETISSSYQIKSNNLLSTTCENNQYNRQIEVFKTNNFIDMKNNEAISVEQKNVQRNIKGKELPKQNIQDIKSENKKRRSESEVRKPNKNHTSKNKHDRPQKQYSKNKDRACKKQENYKDKYRKKIKIDTPPVENSLYSDKNGNDLIFKSVHGNSTLQTDASQDRSRQLNDFRNLVDQNNRLNQTCKIKETPTDSRENVDNEDDDVVVIEEKKMKSSKHEENEIHVKSDNTTLSNNFFLISNDSTKDKQNVKYLILNNNDLFKTLNFDGANKSLSSGNILNNENRQQANLLLLNNDKNGNVFLLNKDVSKQSNSFLLNNNSLYNPCETQYFIINDTSTTFQQQITDNSQRKSVTAVDNAFDFTPNCDSTLLVDPPRQIKIAMDTPIDIQENDGSIKSCVKHYDTQLDCDKSVENTTVMPMLSQESNSVTKDLIQNKENILVLNNHVNEEHFKFDSNDSSVQVRLDDSMYYLNEKISNELKMGGGGKCSEIPQIYFINDLESPLSVSSEYCVDTSVKDTPPCSVQTTNQLELYNYKDLDKIQKPSTSDSSAVVKEDVNSNTAQLNDEHVLPLFKANSSLDSEKTKLSSLETTHVKQTENSSPEKNLKSNAQIKYVPDAKSKLTPLKHNSSSFLKHLKNKLEKDRPVSKNQILNKAPSNYLNKNAPIVKKKKLDDMDSVLTNDPVENASKILALCMQKESEAQQKSLTCQICSMVFCDEKVLNKHVEEHSTLGRLTCTVCKKVFNNMKTLKTHSRIHTGEKPFRCSVCGKSFSQRGILSSHLAVHAGVKPHVCKQCGHAFTQKSQLRLHEMRHGNIRQFACSVCPFKFTTKSDLQRHQRSHEGVKPFSCEYCDKTFTRQIIMKEHLNRHKGVQPYSCCSCDRSFFDAQSLNKHKLIHKTLGDSFKPTNASKLFGGVG